MNCNSTSTCRALRLISSVMLIVTGLAGCSTAGDIVTLDEVKPWQRGALAKDDMQLINDAMEQAVDEHIYFSREASTGGVVLQGGGCGCN